MKQINEQDTIHLLHICAKNYLFFGMPNKLACLSIANNKCNGIVLLSCYNAVTRLIKQIKVFRPETIKDLEPFLAQYQNAQLLFAEYFEIERKDVYIMSTGDKKSLKAVTRPNETPYQIPVIYVIYEIEGNAASGSVVKTKSFSVTDSADAINKFLAGVSVQNILAVPITELTGSLDNYVAGEYGPVPDRTPARVRSHKLVVVYKE